MKTPVLAITCSCSWKDVVALNSTTRTCITDRQERCSALWVAAASEKSDRVKLHNLHVHHRQTGLLLSIGGVCFASQIQQTFSAGSPSLKPANTTSLGTSQQCVQLCASGVNNGSLLIVCGLQVLCMSQLYTQDSLWYHHTAFSLAMYTSTASSVCGRPSSTCCWKNRENSVECLTCGKMMEIEISRHSALL